MLVEAGLRVQTKVKGLKVSSTRLGIDGRGFSGGAFVVPSWAYDGFRV